MLLIILILLIIYHVLFQRLTVIMILLFVFVIMVDALCHVDDMTGLEIKSSDLVQAHKQQTLLINKNKEI
jgi:hypothetical protein